MVWSNNKGILLVRMMDYSVIKGKYRYNTQGVIRDPGIKCAQEDLEIIKWIEELSSILVYRIITKVLSIRFYCPSYIYACRINYTNRTDPTNKQLSKYLRRCFQYVK